MRHVWSLICEKSSIDFENNLLSVFNCLEEIRLVIDRTKTPDNDKILIPTNFQIISFWSIEDSNKENSTEIRGEFIDPDGKVLNEFGSALKAKKGVKRLRNRTNIQGLPITIPGRYLFKIYQKNNNKWNLISELPLDVDLSYKLLEK